MRAVKGQGWDIRSCVGPRQHCNTRDDSAAAHDNDPGILDLAFLGLATQLRNRLIDKSHAVNAAVWELSVSPAAADDLSASDTSHPARR
jgi:hypothetical protein